MNRIIVAGGGGHAKVFISILKRLEYDIIGYTEKTDKGIILGVQYLGNDNVLKGLKKNYDGLCAAVGVGQLTDVSIRKELYGKLRSFHYPLPKIIAPSVIVGEDVSIGVGSFIGEGVVINTGVNIGRMAILNTNASIDHDCVIGDFVHIAPGVTLSGGVQIGDNVLIGAGSTIIQNITIHSNVIIGAGSVLINDCTESGTYVGNPARRIK